MDRNDEIILKQVKRIHELEEELEDCKAAISRVHRTLYAIGGPLNDNKLGFSNEQLGEFRAIAGAIDGIEWQE